MGSEVRGSTIPLWVQALDGAAIVALVFAAFLILFGGFGIELGPISFRVRSPERIIFIAAALIAIRHVARPQDSLHRRIVLGLRAHGDASPVTIARLALVSRITVLIVGYFAVLTIGIDGPKGRFEVSGDPIVNLPARFDAGWYGGIALDGYSFQGRFDRQQNVAFFPAFPMLMRAVGYPAGAFTPGMPYERRMARLLWSGVFVSLIAFGCGAVYVWNLARDAIGEARATDAVALLAAYPFAAFFSAPYAESLFLLGAVAAFYHFRRQEWAAAALWGLLVGLTRPNGFLLSVPLACFVIEERWRAQITKSRNHQITNRQIAKSLLTPAAPVVGMLAYSAYVHHLTGSWFGWARLHEAWGRSFEGVAPIARGFGWIENEGLLRVVAGVPFDTLNALGLIFALAMLWPVFRHLGLAWGVFVLVNVVPPLLAGGVLSMGRLTSTLFPVFLALAVILPRRAVTPLVTAFALGQGLAAALFFTWRPLF